MLLNKMLNHDHHKQIKPSSLEVIFLPPRHSPTPPSYLNRTSSDAFWIRKRLRLAVNKAGTRACQMYARTANTCSARFRPSDSFSKVCVLRDWWPRPSPGEELSLWQVQEAASCVTVSGCDRRTSAHCRLDSQSYSHIRMRHGRTPTHQMLAGQRQEAEWSEVWLLSRKAW